MSSGPENKTQWSAALEFPGLQSDERSPSTVTAVLHVRWGAGAPFEGTVEINRGVAREFHGWLELMGLVEEARGSAGP
jgi:hypothetical protein